MNRSPIAATGTLGGAILLFSAVAALAANRFADTPQADLPALSLTLAATGLSGLAAWWGIQRWSSGLGFGARMLIFSGLGFGVFVANMAVAASMMFISTHDLRLLLILCGYALGAAALPSLAFGRSLGGRLAKVEYAAAQIASGD